MAVFENKNFPYLTPFSFGKEENVKTFKFSLAEVISVRIFVCVLLVSFFCVIFLS